MKVRLDAQEDPVVNESNLVCLTQRILLRGQTCTYCQMFSNNPCFETARFLFYLDPDPGGPNQHPQWNINCDPKRGEFHTLVIRRKLLEGLQDAGFVDQYRKIEFGRGQIVMSLEQGRALPHDVWEIARVAITELLQEASGT